MDNRYYKLKSILKQNKDWPLSYMFKFIVPNKEGKVEKVINVFPKDAKKSFRYTDSLRYVSITCILEMHNAEEIIAITEAAMAIPGVIML
jgi:hypothetical protein